jgi:CRISPR type III-associated protein (TIGR04423 family)
MAQIWKSEADEFCDGMEVMKLQKVVFAGFSEKIGEA